MTIQVWHNIKYGRHDRCLLDVYTNLEQKIPGPTVICTHGGSWVLSDKNTAAEMAIALVEQGCCVVAPSYSLSTFTQENVQALLLFEAIVLVVVALSTNGHKTTILIMLTLFFGLVLLTYVQSKTQKSWAVTHPTHVQNLSEVVKWAYINSKRFNGNPDQIVMLGHSAGGHLVTLVSNNPLYLRELNLNQNVIKGTIALSGVFSDKRLQQTRVGSEILKMVFGKRKAYYDAFPIYHCRETSPPHLLINGSYDYTLDLHTLDLCTALRERGVYVKTFVAEGETHFSVRKAWRTTNKTTFDTIMEFIHEILLNDQSE